MVWTGLIWLRIVTSGGLLWTRYWTFGFHKILGSSWVAAQLAASQERLGSMKLVNHAFWFSSWRVIYAAQLTRLGMNVRRSVQTTNLLFTRLSAFLSCPHCFSIVFPDILNLHALRSSGMWRLILQWS
jgi:hypothetical protein